MRSKSWGCTQEHGNTHEQSDEVVGGHDKRSALEVLDALKNVGRCCKSVRLDNFCALMKPLTMLKKKIHIELKNNSMGINDD
jgi:hypothetical protein